MERTDVVSAQTLTSSQLSSIRDKIVVDRLTLRKAVLSLYPNFDVSPANLQDLRQSLLNTFPEMNAALKVSSLSTRIKSRDRQLSDLRSQNSLPEGILDIKIDWKKVPSALSRSEDFKSSAVEILNFMVETERLRKLRSKKDKQV